MRTVWHVFEFLRRTRKSAPTPAPAPEAAPQAAPEAAPESPLAADWLVVGLGNPGPEYAATRHNAGYLVLDALLDEEGVELRPLPGVAARVAAVDGVAYTRSNTYMNTSGEAVGPLAALLGVPPERVVVVHDELDLPPGKVRIKLGGNENGHNGLKSITAALGTRDYARVRVGIGRPPQGTAVPDWVLAPFGDAADPATVTDPATAATDPATPGEVGAAIELAAEAVRVIVRDGIAKAQNEIHPRS